MQGQPDHTYRDLAIKAFRLLLITGQQLELRDWAEQIAPGAEARAFRDVMIEANSNMYDSSQYMYGLPATSPRSLPYAAPSQQSPPQPFASTFNNNNSMGLSSLPMSRPGSQPSSPRGNALASLFPPSGTGLPPPSMSSTARPMSQLLSSPSRRMSASGLPSPSFQL